MEEPPTPNRSDREPLLREDTPLHDPDAADQPPSGDERPKLKLKKLLTPLSPHLTAPRPDRDPRPENKESQDVPGAGLEPEAGESSQAQEVAEDEGAAEDEAADSSGESDGTPVVAASGVNPVAKPRVGTRKWLAVILVPVLLVVAMALLLDYLFDPLGRRLEPIVPMRDVTVSQGPATPEKQVEEAGTPARALQEKLDTLPLEEYIQALEARQVFVSENPQGIFIDTVFFPVGSLVNPQLELRFLEVVKEDSGNFAEFSGPENTVYRVRTR